MPPHTRFNPRLHPSTSHVELHRRYYTFYLPHSKTDQLHRGHTIQLTSTTPVTICPVRHMRTYLETRPSMRGPLFTFSDGRPLTRHLCLHYLCSSLRHLGCNPDDFNTHSFWIGAATTAVHRGAVRPLSNTSAGGGATPSRHTSVPILLDTRHPYHPGNPSHPPFCCISLSDSPSLYCSGYNQFSC